MANDQVERCKIKELCSHCSKREEIFAVMPQLKFYPSTLRQKMLLNYAYLTYEQTGDRSLDNFSAQLTPNMIADIRAMHNELRNWCSKNRRYDFDLGPTNFDHCFFNRVHWYPRESRIDYRSTARMILQADLGFDRRNEFLLAAFNCLEDEVQRLWSLLSWSARLDFNHFPLGVADDFVAIYWIGRCRNDQAKIGQALDSMIDEWKNGRIDNFETFDYFWPIILRRMGGIDSVEARKFFDHAFHSAIDYRNKATAIFVWNLAPPKYYRSILSAENCCGSPGDCYAFVKVIESGRCDLVQFLWTQTNQRERNSILLAEHAMAFCKAAECGFETIVEFLWRNADRNQRFVLLYEQRCAAFRFACANGHLEIVIILWTGASSEERRDLLSISDYESISIACRNGFLAVVEFLMENLGDELKSILISNWQYYSVLSKCIGEAASADGTFDSSITGVDGYPILRYLFSKNVDDCSGQNRGIDKTDLMRALLWRRESALTALLKRGEQTKKWREIQNLFEIFGLDEWAHLWTNMSIDLARACGFLPPKK